MSQVMVGAYSASGAGGGRGALLPAPPPGKAVISRGPTRNANGAKDPEGPAVTVFIGKDDDLYSYLCYLTQMI